MKTQHHIDSVVPRPILRDQCQFFSLSGSLYSVGLLAVIIVIVTVVPGRAQDVQVPFDTTEAIDVVTPELREQLNLFQDIDQFRQARLFRDAAGGYVLEIEYGPKGAIRRDQRTLSESDVADLRARVTEWVRKYRPAAVLNQEGRTELLVGSTIMGLTYYGWAIPTAIGLSDRSAGAVYLLISSGSFFGPFLATRNRPVTEAQAALSFYGGTRGIVHGIALSSFTPGDELGRGPIIISALTGLGEAFAGYRVAGRKNMSRGTAEAIMVGGDVGLLLGVSAATLINPENPGRYLPSGLVLVGSAGGIVAGNWLAKQERITEGDGRLLRMTTMLGAYNGAAAMSLAGVETTRPVTAVVMGTGLLGLGLGRHLIRNRDFADDQAILTGLGTLSGGLIGGGLTWLLAPEETTSTYLAVSAAGGNLGFSVMYALFQGEAQQAATENAGRLTVEPALFTHREMRGLLPLSPAPGIGLQIRAHF